MLRREAFLVYSILIFSIVTLLCFNSAAFAEDNFVITDIIPDNSGKLVVVNGKNTGDVSKYKVTKLDNPDRLVIDIPNAVLVGPKKFLNISNTGIVNVKVAQFSANPDIVRLVFTSDSKENIKDLSFHKSKNSLIFKLNGVEVQKHIHPTIYKDKDIDETDTDNKKILDNENIKDLSTKQGSLQPENNVKNIITTDNQTNQPLNNLKNYNNQNMVVNTVNFINNQLVISGIGAISVREPFILRDPTRLVMDIPNSTVISPELLKNYVFNNTDIVRVGQFTPDTIRIVLETEDPDNYKTAISPDLQSLVISPKFDLNLSILPDGNNIGQIQDVDVQYKKEDNTTSIILTSNQPIIHNIRHLYRPNRINIELFNINAPKKTLISDLPKTDQFHGINISFIDKYPYGSCLSFPIKRGTKVESKLSIDGKVLQVILRGSKFTPIVRGKVVIDPGHGGNEPGANRAGIYEKHITLNVAKKVYKYLYEAGIDVIMTRDRDNTLTLQQRTYITNRENPDLFVSIHVNACTNPRINGLETHWYTPQSRELAKVVHSSLVNSIKAFDRGIFNSRFYVIHHTDVPAILVEIGFMSNEEERCQVLTEDRQEITAKAIADGILMYLGIKR